VYVFCLILLCAHCNIFVAPLLGMIREVSVDVTLGWRLGSASVAVLRVAFCGMDLRRLRLRSGRLLF